MVQSILLVIVILVLLIKNAYLKIAIQALRIHMENKGTLPTPEEVEECSKKALSKAFHLKS